MSDNDRRLNFHFLSLFTTVITHHYHYHYHYLPVDDLKSLIYELRMYNPAYMQKKALIALNKTDLIPDSDSDSDSDSDDSDSDSDNKYRLAEKLCAVMEKEYRGYNKSTAHNDSDSDSDSDNDSDSTFKGLCDIIHTSAITGDGLSELKRAFKSKLKQ